MCSSIRVTSAVRYSALSFFGMVPAALMEARRRRDRRLGTRDACRRRAWIRHRVSPIPRRRSASQWAPARAAGRDKLTLLLPDRARSVRPLGRAADRGKHRQRTAPASCRLPASTRQTRRCTAAIASFVASTDEGVWRRIRQPSTCRCGARAIGAEFVRWEIATARRRSAARRINPFDEPNVQQTKDATRTLLGQFQQSGQAPGPRTIDDGIEIAASDMARASTQAGGARTVFSRCCGRGDYFALLALSRSGSVA